MGSRRDSSPAHRHSRNAGPKAEKEPSPASIAVNALVQQTDVLEKISEELRTRLEPVCKSEDKEPECEPEPECETVEEEGPGSSNLVAALNRQILRLANIGADLHDLIASLEV